MTYTVIVEAEGVTPEQIEAARTRFCAVLEAGVGGPDQVAPCFRAWAKEFDPGVGAITEQEKRAAAAYLLAGDRAEAAGNEMLQPKRGKYNIRLSDADRNA